jgi:hypothetical protein
MPPAIASQEADLMNTATSILSAAALTVVLFTAAGCTNSDSGAPAPTNTIPATATATAPPPTVPPATATRPPAATNTPVSTATPTMSGELDIAVCAPDAGPFSAEIDHPFFPMPVGTQWILIGDDDGEPIRVVITSLPDTEMVAGVTTRVIEEREWEDGELVEVSRNFFVLNAAGDLCYYGEDVDDYEAGQIVDHGGAWRAGVDGALPGILLPANPQIGQTFKQEVAIGVAEDQAEQVAAGESVTVGLGAFTDTIRYEESSPLDSGTSLKIYARGVGLLVDESIERIPMSLTFCGTLDGEGCAPESERVDLTPPVFSNPTSVTNPLFPVSQQHSVVLLGMVDGEPFKAEVTLLATPKTITVNGQPVQTLESQYVAFLDGRLQEVALDWYGQDDTGAVWYFGEDVFNYEEGILADTGGTWLGGTDGPVAMIMPANPQVGDVYRPENIPGLVFEEVTVQEIGLTVEGPYGPVAGAIVVEELHLEGSGAIEDKTFAPGYGEFFTGADGDVEALALAVPTDALSTPLPAELQTLATGADDIFDAAEAEDWDAASTALASMTTAWETYRATGVSALLEEQLDDALRGLGDEIDNEDPVEARNAAIQVARATLDFHLRHRPPTDVDRARFRLWVQQILVDAEDDDLEGVSGDVTTLDWVLARFAHTLSSADASAIAALLDDLEAAIAAEDLEAATAAAEELLDTLGD